MSDKTPHVVKTRVVRAAAFESIEVRTYSNDADMEAALAREQAVWQGDFMTRAEWEAKREKAVIGSAERAQLSRDEPQEYRCDQCKKLLGIRVNMSVRWAPGSAGHTCDPPASAT